MPRATMNDVAELAGVSIKTVSRVVNGEPSVRKSTREKVVRAIAQLDYRPNLSARSLARQRSHLVVLVYDDPGRYEAPSAGYVIRMQNGALRACRERRYELLIHPCTYGAADVRRELQELVGRVRPDGIVLAAPLSNMAHFVDAIAETRTPLVCLPPGAETPGRLAVSTNDREICAEMTRYLASLPGFQVRAALTKHSAKRFACSCASRPVRKGNGSRPANHRERNIQPSRI